MELDELENRVVREAEKHSKCLTEGERGEISDLIKHNESGVAYEMLCEQLYEHECQVTREDLNELREIGDFLNISHGAIALWETELMAEKDN